ncbi:hypothetical protein ONZ45_g5543 [Pleurotus djamor]|nr:hypothetical protein ONZ45_g5543 [Pleurotus djamor]
MFAPLLFLLLSLGTYVEAKLLRSAKGLDNARFDFVIVGGGTAGSVLANRLSTNPDISVLVIEAGDTNNNNLATIVPFLGVSLANTVVDWNFTTTPQTGLFNRTFHYARGHVLGGSSVINLLTWNRGSNDTWDEWARITEDPGWSWNSVASFYNATSSIAPPADGHDTTGEIDPDVHGIGPVKVSLPGFSSELDSRVINTSKNSGSRFPFNEDINGGQLIGFGFLQASINTSTRSSADTAYLEPVLSRPNLYVLPNAQVTRLLETDPSSRLPDFRTVEFTTGGRSFTVHGRREVILAAGVIGTPQLLLLSGIGPQDELKHVGIKSVVNLPSVGKNLTDHPMVPNYFAVNSPNNGTFDNVLRNDTLFGKDIGEWMSSGTGLFVNSPANTLGFMRLNSSILQNFSDPSSGPLSAHTEIIFVDGFAQLSSLAQPLTGNFISILTAVVSPASRGTVSLASKDPLAKPLVNPSIFSNAFDSMAMVQAMKDAREFISGPEWTGFVADAIGGISSNPTDEELLTYARNVSVTVNHPVGTAAMSPRDASWGVVDPDLFVKGTKGLRIVDASVFVRSPYLPPLSVVDLDYSLIR